MQLDTVSAVLRPRSHWEAIDLGFAMVRRWLWPIYSAWLVVVIPLTIILNALCWQWPWVAALLLWWLKPLLDRIPLFVVSRALFGDVPTLATTLRALPKLLLTHCIPVLTWLRFDPARSFHLPVIQLEGLRGRERRQRQNVLGNVSGSVWITMICMNLDILLQIALTVFVMMLFPEFVPWDMQWWLEEHSLAEQYAFNLAALIALTLIEPFYVIAGFSLYLNRRTILEGWDLEIGFRRLAQRLQMGYKAALLSISGAAVVVLCIFSVTAAPLAVADETSNDQSIKIDDDCEALFAERKRLREANSEIKQALGEVFEQGAFRHCELVTEWRFKEPQSTRSGTFLLPNLAQWLELMLWIIVAAVVIVLLWWFYKRFDPNALRLPGKESAAAAPIIIQGQEITPESFDQNAAQQALSLWQSGQQRAALSLLYRATLAGLLRYQQIDFGRSTTELECLQKASQQLGDSPLVNLLKQVTHSWQMIAYAHRQPADEQMEALCQQWLACFQQPQRNQSHVSAA